MAGGGDAPRSAAPRQLVQSYGGGGFRVAGVHHSGSILVFPDRTMEWPVANAAEISTARLSEVLRRAERVRVLVVGCGPAFLPRPHHLDSELRTSGIGLEWMDTGAACRTFNVLLLEDRDVAAALIAVD